MRLNRVMLLLLLLTALLLALAPVALASTKWYVDGVNGSDANNCMSAQHACKTIGHAISLASSGDSIMVAAATYTENLTISFSLKVVGSGANTTIIDGGGVGRVVTISNANAHVTLSKVTIRYGKSYLGGGINNKGTLTINNSTVSVNLGTGFFSTYNGGGINNSGTLTINNSTISENTIGSTVTGVSSAYGGGLYNSGTMTINNSTVSGNFAEIGQSFDSSVYGAGVYNFGTATISSSTISGNYNFNPDGTAGFGAGIAGAATLQNSILSNNFSSDGNCYGTMTSNGYNLSNDGSCNFNSTGDLNNTDPKLGTLGNHGGPTQTMPLLSGSPAIDAGNPAGCTDGKGHLLKTDQRGMPRPDKEDSGGCDMGAYESQSD